MQSATAPRRSNLPDRPNHHLLPQIGDGWIGFIAAAWRLVLPASISLLVETNSLFLIAGNRSRQLRKCSGTSALAPAGESDIREIPCTFPIDQGTARETSSPQTPPTAIESVLLETLTREVRWSPKTPCVRGVLGAGLWRGWTGDGGLAAWKRPDSVFVSVAKLGGSLSIRLGEI